MRFIIIVLLAFATSCQQQENSEEMTTYYFIRHAEKDLTNPTDQDPKLTKEGNARSRRWVEVFKEVPFDMVYSSRYIRAHDTAKPIAEDHNLPVSTYNTEKLNDENFQQETKGKTVLVVGHSNLNPEFVNYLIEENKYADLPETEYGSLFVVNISPSGEKRSHVLYVN